MSVLADPTTSPAISTFTLTTGGTAQLLAAGNQRRQSIAIQPQTEVSLVNFGATAGVQATGTLTAGSNPANTDTIVINGVTFTFVTGASTATNVHIGAAKEDTMTNLQAVLAASVNASITVATYSVNAAILTITYVAGGTGGNAYTLADSTGSKITKSAATLAGGSNTVGNGFSLAANTMYFFNAADFPSVRNDIWLVSATNSAKSVYMEGFGA